MLKHSRCYLCSEENKQLQMYHITPFVLLSLPLLPLLNFSGKGEQWVQIQTLEKTLINVLKLRVTLCKQTFFYRCSKFDHHHDHHQTLHGFHEGADVMQNSRR